MSIEEREAKENPRVPHLGKLAELMTKMGTRQFVRSGESGMMISSRQLHTWAWSSGVLGWDRSSEEQQQLLGMMPQVPHHSISTEPDDMC